MKCGDVMDDEIEMDIEADTSHLKTADSIMVYISDHGCAEISCAGSSIPNSEYNLIPCPFHYKHKNGQNRCQLRVVRTHERCEAVKERANEKIEEIIKFNFLDSL